MAEAPRLFLITPPILDADAFMPLLDAALANGDVACVLIRIAAAAPGGGEAVIRKLTPVVQRQGAAALVEDLGLAKRLDVDGVHVDRNSATLGDALAALKPDKIVGAGGLDRRDVAMTLGEAGADYLMFGRFSGGANPATHQTVCDMVDWWSNLFTVPCVGYAYSPNVADDIAKAGAEFVGLCDGVWDHGADVSAVISSVRRALSSVPEAVR